MKTTKVYLVLAALTLGPWAASGQQPPPTAGTRGGPQPATTAAATAASSNGRIRLNFSNAPLGTAMQAFANATGYSLSIDSQNRNALLTGRVDMYTGQDGATKEEAYSLFSGQLQANGYAATKSGNIIRIVSLDNGYLSLKKVIGPKPAIDPDDIPDDGEVVTQIIQVNHVTAQNLINNLAPLLPSTSILNANADGNELLITDTQSNIRRVAKIIKEIDSSIATTSTIKVIQLRFADATTMQDILNQMFATQTTRGGGAGGGGGAVGLGAILGLGGLGGANTGARAGGANTGGGRGGG